MLIAARVYDKDTLLLPTPIDDHETDANSVCSAPKLGRPRLGLRTPAPSPDPSLR